METRTPFFHKRDESNIFSNVEEPMHTTALLGDFKYVEILHLLTTSLPDSTHIVENYVPPPRTASKVTVSPFLILLKMPRLMENSEKE
jgi:hypothetical protein